MFLTQILDLSVLAVEGHFSGIQDNGGFFSEVGRCAVCRPICTVLLLQVALLLCLLPTAEPEYVHGPRKICVGLCAGDRCIVAFGRKRDATRQRGSAGEGIGSNG